MRSIAREAPSLAGEDPLLARIRCWDHRTLALQRNPREHLDVKIKIRNSASKRAKKTGFRTRQKTVGGRKVNSRQRKRHGSI